MSVKIYLYTPAKIGKKTPQSHTLPQVMFSVKMVMDGGQRYPFLSPRLTLLTAPYHISLLRLYGVPRESKTIWDIF